MSTEAEAIVALRNGDGQGLEAPYRDDPERPSGARGHVPDRGRADAAVPACLPRRRPLPSARRNSLHIAHVLWGGLLMGVALVMLLSLLTWTSQLLAAVIGGVGFGPFIDELGKFMTADNNYFFKPTASLIYVVFIVFYLAARELRHFRKQTLPSAIAAHDESPFERLISLGKVARPASRAAHQAHLRLILGTSATRSLVASPFRTLALATPHEELIPDGRLERLSDAQLLEIVIRL